MAFDCRIKPIKDGVATFNPQSPTEITNKWPWAELNGLTLDTTGKTRSQQEFLLHIRKKGKVETMKFSTEHRDELLTEAMQFFKSVASPIQVFFWKITKINFC